KVDEVVHPKSDDGLKAGTETVNIERSDEKDKNADVDAIDVDNLTSGDSPIDKSVVPSIAKRLRSNT
ncbi:hypothetical protein A2U01_0111140, partial [Trifolium medium]|nr:hypothetical protein [Trifolium medium]